MKHSVKIYKLGTYPRNFWFVRTAGEYDQLSEWMRQNGFDLRLETVGYQGYGFKILGDTTLFMLTWVE